MPRHRRGTLAAAVIGCTVLLHCEALATMRYGPIQISGNLESQQLLRIDESTSSVFDAANLVQQRNVFRLQYEHELVKRGQLFETISVPGVKQAGFFAYYRAVYDSIYDIAPGPFLRANDGSKAGGFSTFSNRERHALAFENTLREVFVDLELSRLPVSFRIGRQQIVWGNTVNFRALDSTNALDLSWHFQQEAGILGKVGFSELRIPAWAVKMLVRLPSAGPFSGGYLEAFDIPFEFTPTRLRFLPRPWGLPLRNPFRGGLAVPVNTPAGPVFLQPCFDRTGSRLPNDEDGNPLTPTRVDFSDANESGFCPTRGLQESRLSQGIYDAHDPTDVNQFGVRYGGSFDPLQLGFTLNYKYQRHVADATGATLAKTFGSLVQSSPLSYLQPAPHVTTDALTGKQTPVLGYLRIPIEFYYPYVSILGLSLDYFESFTAAVYNFEIAATKGVPIATLNPDPKVPGLRRTWEYEVGLLVDRPTWIRFLNPRSTWTVLAQGNLSMIPDRQEVIQIAPGRFAGGDVGAPSSVTIPGQFRDQAKLDQRRRFEYLTLVAMTTFYRGGSLAPLIGWVSDWTDAPAMEWQAFLQILPTQSLIIEPGFRIFWTNGRTVDDRYSVARMTGRSEIQLKTTYQF
jgi:hypothetical protein